MNDFCIEEYFLNLAIKEAKKSKSIDGYLVGAIIVKDNKIISKAYSKENSKYHAEEWAIKKCKENLSGAVIYVTMEPCDVRRSGKQSCCDWIIKSGIKKVVYGILDPDTYVVCNGIEKLSKAKIETFHLKKLEQRCKELTPDLPFNQPI